MSYKYLFWLNDLWIEEVGMFLKQSLQDIFWLREEDQIVQMNGVNFTLVLILPFGSTRSIVKTDNGRIILEYES